MRVVGAFLSLCGSSAPLHTFCARRTRGCPYAYLRISMQEVRGVLRTPRSWLGKTDVPKMRFRRRRKTHERPRVFLSRFKQRPVQTRLRRRTRPFMLLLRTLLPSLIVRMTRRSNAPIKKAATLSRSRLSFLDRQSQSAYSSSSSNSLLGRGKILHKKIPPK